MIDLNQLSKDMLEVANLRGKREGLPKTNTVGMMKWCAGEVVEAIEAFNEYSYFQGGTNEQLEQKKVEFAGELADVVCCALITFALHGINPEIALVDCFTKNQLRAENGN